MKRRLRLLLLALLLAVLSACGEPGGREGDVSEPTQERKPLLLYNLAYNVQLSSKQLIEILYPEIEYTEKWIDSYDSAAMEKVGVEILAGAGPDVLFCMLPFESGSTSVLLTSLLLQDAFMELEPLMEKAGVDREAYTLPVFENPLDTRVRTITTELRCPMFACTAEREAAYGLQFKSGMTVREFSLELDKYMAQTPDDAPIFNLDMSFGEFLSCLGDWFVDLAEKKTRFDTEEFREAAGCYRKLWQRQANRAIVEKIDYGYDTELFVKGESLLYEHPYLGLDSFALASEMGSILNSNGGETLRVYPFPSFGQNPGLQLAVSGILRSCDFPEAAFYVLQRDLERSSDGYISMHAYRTIEAEYESAIYSRPRPWRGDIVAKYYAYEPIPLSPLNADRIYETITSARSFIPNQILLEDFIEPCLQPYFDGERSLDPCIKELTNRVNLYLNE